MFGKRRWLILGVCAVAVSVSIALWAASSRAQTSSGLGALSFFVDLPDESTGRAYAVLRSADAKFFIEKYSDASGYVFFGDLPFGAYTVTLYGPPGTMPFADEEMSYGNALISYRRHHDDGETVTEDAEDPEAHAEGDEESQGAKASPLLTARSYVVFRDVVIDYGGNFTGLVEFVPEVNITGNIQRASSDDLVLERMTGSGYYVKVDHQPVPTDGKFVFCAVPPGQYRLRLSNSAEPLLPQSQSAEEGQTANPGTFPVGEVSVDIGLCDIP